MNETPDFPVVTPAAGAVPAPEQPTTDFSVKPVLVGESVVLRPFDLDQDLPAIRDWITDPEVMRFTDGDPTPPPAWDDDLEARMRAWYGTRADQSDRLDLAIVDRASGACVGEAVLNNWDRANRSCNFRILLTAAGRARGGVGTEALRLIVGHGFEQVGLHRISLTVYGHNPRARRSYEKAGFVLEGTRRDALRYGDTWVDDHDMAILAPDWAEHRGFPDRSRRLR